MRIGDDRGIDLLERVEVELGQLDRDPIARIEAVQPLAGVAARGRGDEPPAAGDSRRAGPRAPAESRGAGDQNPGDGVALQRRRFFASLTERPSNLRQFHLDPAAQLGDLVLSEGPVAALTSRLIARLKLPSPDLLAAVEVEDLGRRR